MSSTRILRSLPAWRTTIRQPAMSRTLLSTHVKVASTSAMVTKDSKVAPSFISRKPEVPRWGQLPPMAQLGRTPLHAAMPQLVPFYFVNESVTAFIALPIMIYFLSKYILPQTVRRSLARLFISKL